MVDMAFVGVGGPIAGALAWGAVLLHRWNARRLRRHVRLARVAELRALRERGPKVLQNSLWKPPRPRPVATVRDEPSLYEHLSLVDAKMGELQAAIARGVTMMELADKARRISDHHRHVRALLDSARRDV